MECKQGGVGTEVKPIVKVDVHAPIFYFPKIIDTHGNRSHTSQRLGNANNHEEYLTVRRLVLSSSDRGERPTPAWMLEWFTSLT